MFGIEELFDIGFLHCTTFRYFEWCSLGLISKLDLISEMGLISRFKKAMS